MEKYAFALTTCGQHYQISFSSDIDSLFLQAKHALPIKSRFEKYLQQGLLSAEGYFKITDPDPYAGEEGFEILLGNSQDIQEYIRIKSE